MHHVAPYSVQSTEVEKVAYSCRFEGSRARGVASLRSSTFACTKIPDTDRILEAEWLSSRRCFRSHSYCWLLSSSSLTRTPQIAGVRGDQTSTVEVIRSNSCYNQFAWTRPSLPLVFMLGRFVSPVLAHFVLVAYPFARSMFMP